jgi:hypothetical protein
MSSRGRTQITFKGSMWMLVLAIASSAAGYFLVAPVLAG